MCPADYYPMSAEDEPEAPPSEPVAEIQNALAKIDSDSLVAGFVCIVEWIEPDGSSAVSVLNTAMPPWHRAGLLQYAAEFDQSLFSPILIEMDDDDWDE